MNHQPAVTSWDDAVRNIATALVALAAAPARRAGWDLGAADLDVAVIGRAAVLAGAAVVLADLAPRSRQPDPSGRRDLLAVTDRDPIHALGLLLRDRGRAPTSRRPSELLDAAAPGSPATRTWAAAGRHALIADRIWTSQLRPLDGDQAWHVVEQVAAVTELLALLDPALRQAATKSGRLDITTYLDRCNGLRVVAHEVTSLAAGPARRDSPTAAPSSRLRIRAPEPRRVLTPTDGFTAVAATRRLTAILRDTTTLDPQQVRALATVARDLAVLAAASGATTSSGREATGGETTGAELTPQLGELAACLNQIVLHRHGEASLVERQAPALDHQLRELATYTRHAFSRRAARPDPADATRLAARLPALVAAIGEQARAEVAARRWAVPDRAEHTHLRYVIASPKTGCTPRMLDELDQAGAAARTLTKAAGRPLVDHGRAAQPTSHTHLHAIARFRDQPRRPPHPAAVEDHRLPPTA